MQKIQIISKGQSVSMNDEWFDLADHQHFWMRWRFKVFVEVLKPFWQQEMKVLEIGCGNGVFMFQFEQHFRVSVDGCDLNLFALQHAMPVEGNLYLYDVCEQNPDFRGKYDVVLIFDVLEHITDDTGFLEAAKFHLKDDGLLVVGVPAHQELYSEYDRNVGHKRRYARKQLENTLKIAGFTQVKSNFWGLSLLPVLVSRKMLLKLIPEKKIISTGFKSPHALFNKLMIGLMKLETGIISKPFSGISLMATGRK